jgi:glutamine synthetase
VKAIAAQHGLIASFMPKPIYGINGSGMHCHQSLFDDQGNNLFFDANDQYNLSQLAYGFIAGQLEHARALSAVVAPTVNSYKRLVPGYEAPVYVGWAQINRSALIRTPLYAPGREKSIRAELRCPDPSANPYLALAAMLAAALDGVQRELEAPRPLNDINVYNLTKEERLEMNIAELPGSLAEALKILDENQVIKDALGSVIYESFRRAKCAEVDEYRTRVTDWEVARYLETT